MYRYVSAFLLTILAIWPGSSSALRSAGAENPRHPFPQHRAYAPGSIRPTQRTQQQQDIDVRAFYDHWKATYLVAAGATPSGNVLYRVAFGATPPARDRTVSEGQGYGMIIVAIMAGYDADAQAIFDGLWEFSRAHPSSIDPRLMDFAVPDSNTGNDSAFDGDADIAFGLLLADQQWGSAGRIDYRAAAENVITAIDESTIGPESRLPMLGDWVNPGGNAYNQYTPRSSDFMPAHFRAYGRATRSPTWTTVVTSTQQVIDSLQAAYSPATGLLPDFIVPVSAADHTPRPASPGFLEGANDGNYYYNAGRDPWRIATDALLNGDPTSAAQAAKMANWAVSATGGNPANLKGGYRLDGTPLPKSDYFTTFFAAPLAVAAMTAPAQQAWLNALYDAVCARHDGYYEDSVTLLCLIVLTGNYWDPTTIADGQGGVKYLPVVVR